MDPSKMEFQVWKQGEAIKDGALIRHQDVCIAKRWGDELKPEFHTMAVGDQRQLGADLYITRVA